MTGPHSYSSGGFMWFHVVVMFAIVVGVLIAVFLYARRRRPTYRTRPRWVEWLIRGLCGAGAVAILAGVSYATWRDIQPPAGAGDKATPPVTVAVPTQSLEELCRAHPEWSPPRPQAGQTVQVDQIRLIGHVLVLDELSDGFRVTQAGSFDIWWNGSRSISGSVAIPSGVVNYDLTVTRLGVEKDGSTGEMRLRPDIGMTVVLLTRTGTMSSSGSYRPGKTPLVLLDVGDGFGERSRSNGLTMARNIVWDRRGCKAVLVLQLAGRDDPLRRTEASALLPASTLTALLSGGLERSDLWLHRGKWWNQHLSPSSRFFQRFAPGALLVLLGGVLAARAAFRLPGWAMLVSLPLAVIFVAAWDRADLRAQEAMAMDSGAPFSVRMGALNRAAETFFFVRTAADLAGRVERDPSASSRLRRLAGLQCRAMDAMEQARISPLGKTESVGISLSHGEGGQAVSVELGVTIAFPRGQGEPAVIAAHRGGGPLSFLPPGGLAGLVLSQPGTYRRIVAINDDLNVTPLGTEADFLEAAAVCRDVPRLRDLPSFERLVAPLVQQEALRKTSGQ